MTAHILHSTESVRQSLLALLCQTPRSQTTSALVMNMGLGIVKGLCIYVVIALLNVMQVRSASRHPQVW